MLLEGTMDLIIIIIIIPNKVLDDCDKQKKYVSNWGSQYFCLKRRPQNVLPNVTCSPSHRQAGAPTINIQWTLRTAPDLSKNISLAVLFGRNGNSYAVSMQSDT